MLPQRRIKKVTLTAFDRAMFEGLRMAMDVIAGALGQSCEVVFHSFEDPGHSLVKIVNGHVSGRELGSPVTDVFLQILHDKDTELQDLLQYYTNTEDGRPIRCVARLVKNSSGELIGLMGINQDLSVPFIDFVSNFMPRNGSASVVIPEHFSTSARDLRTLF